MTIARPTGAPPVPRLEGSTRSPTHERMPGSARTSIDRIGIALATILGVTPLLPRGPGYLGWPGQGWPDLVVPALAVVWLTARFAARGSSREPAPIPLWPWDLFAAAVGGSAVYGLMSDNLLTSPVFAARLVAVGDLWRPMHQMVHPLYSLRMAVTLLEGWIVLRLVLDACRVAGDPRRRARIALVGWGAGLAAAALFALVQYATHFHLHPYWVRANPSLVRAHATLDDPNALGACLVLGLGLVAGLLRLDDSRRRRPWWILLLALGIAGLATTMSRSAIGAIVIAPAVVLAFGPTPVTRPQEWVRTGARLMVGALLVAVLASMALRAFTSEARRTNPRGPIDMVVKTFDPRESTGWVLRGRLPWWRAAVRIAADHPLTGVGVGRFQRVMRAYGGGKVPENAHNFFLQVSAESGIGAGLVFLVLCGSTIRTFARLGAARTDAGAAAALGGQIGVVAFLLTLLTGHTLRVTSGQVLFASFVALGATAAAPAGWRVPRTSPTRRALAAAAMVAVAAVPPALGVLDEAGPFLGDWGYSVGLYDQERTGGGERYRWTAASARIELAAPADASALIVQTAAVAPVRAGVPVHVRIEAAGHSHDAVASDPGPQAVTFPLRVSREPRRVLVRIDVDPPLVPASDGHSGDTRTLGVQLFVPRFEVNHGPATQ